MWNAALGELCSDLLQSYFNLVPSILEVESRFMSARPPNPAVVSQRRKAPRASSNSAENADERYRLVMEAVAEGIYEWTIAPNHLELSARLTDILGFKTGELT
jgi:PAS domain-containing protein